MEQHTHESALSKSCSYMDEANLLQKEIVSLMRERKRKEATLSYDEFSFYSKQIEELFKQKEFLYKQANDFLRMSNDLFNLLVLQNSKPKL